MNVTRLLTNKFQNSFLNKKSDLFFEAQLEKKILKVDFNRNLVGRNLILRSQICSHIMETEKKSTAMLTDILWQRTREIALRCWVFHFTQSRYL